MSLPLVFHSEAQRDVLEARTWYDRQRRGLGADFAKEVLAALDRIMEAPSHYSVLIEDVRSCQTHRFPYLIYYRVAGERIEILAILHGHRDSSVWQERL
jgi:toxin ParE1/3/4